MSNHDFIDYYQILQVHYDASPEVIRSAYKCLSKVYHPDRSRSDDTHMALLNEAYQCLNDPMLRKEYHKKWLLWKTENAAFRKSSEATPSFANDSSFMAVDAIEAFFHYLYIKDWEAAYTLLSQEDKDKFTLSDFTEWREAIDRCSHMQSFQVKLKQPLSDFAPQKLSYRKAAEFLIAIQEVDALSGEIKKESAKKYMVYDGASWRVWLGMRSLRSATLRFRMQAEKNTNLDPMSVYHNAMSRLDALTGLLSEEGFFEDAQKEANRSKRYKNPITLLAFQIDCSKKERETACLCQLASIIKKNCRTNDVIGRVKEQYIVCLLAETRRLSGEQAAKKFIRLSLKNQSEEYKVRYSVASYDGLSNLSDFVHKLVSTLI